MPAGPPYGNTNAEKWNLEESKKLFAKAIDLLSEQESIKVHGNTIQAYKYDFIGEIAKQLNTFKEIFSHLLKRFPELKPLHNQLITNVEQNCYYNGKKGAIKEASAIMNLKSNHRWTDRLDTTTMDEPINQIELSAKDIKKIIEGL